MLYALIAISGILTAAALWSRNLIIGIVASGSWIFIWQYFTENVSLLASSASDPLVTTVLIVCMGAAVGIPLYIILRPHGIESEAIGDNEVEVSASVKARGFNWRRFLSSGDFGSRNNMAAHHETADEYERRLYKILHGRPVRRRR